MNKAGFFERNFQPGRGTLKNHITMAFFLSTISLRCTFVSISFFRDSRLPRASKPGQVRECRVEICETLALPVNFVGQGKIMSRSW